MSGSRVKLKDVATAAGVAVGTVSRVINGHTTVARPIRDRVHDAIRILGYELDPVAQSMRGRHTRLVACAIRDFDIPRFGEFIKEAERLLREQGYTLLLASTTNRPEVEVELIRAFAQRKVDGMMLTVSDETDAAVLDALGKAPMPLLLIDRDQIQIADRVSVDHHSGALAAVEHLLDLGHRRIALLVGDTKASPSRSRLQGFRAAFQRAGLPPEPRLIRDRVLSGEDAYRETMALMGLQDPPTAIFAAAMDILGGCVRALRTLELTIGKDVSVIAGADSELAELHTPPITAIAWNLAEMGRHAATILIDRITADKQQPFRCLKLQTNLVLRQSCSRPMDLPATTTRVSDA